MPKILVVTPLQRAASGRSFVFPRALESAHGLQFKGQVDYFTPSAVDTEEANVSITRKYQLARQQCLDGKYDALLTLESDMIVPPNALDALFSLQVDVAYGLYVLRHGRKEWNAFTELYVDRGVSLSAKPEVARSLWGQVVEVAGISFGCTLIRHYVLEAVEFRCRAFTHADWCFAMDAAYAGAQQVAHLGVTCGHINGQAILWPDPNEETLYRSEAL